MRYNKITRWIDRRNHEVCLTVARTYYSRKERGKPVPIFKLSFLSVLVQRFFLVFLSLFRFNKNSYVGYKRRTLKAFFKRLIGISRFELRDLLPLQSSFGPISFPTWRNPQVSIIISVHNQVAYTYNCLLSILQNTDNVSYEVILVNDYSTDETKPVLAGVRNTVVIDNEKNIGFLRSCNKALGYAKGRYICFLNNDVQVQPGWLKNLITPFENAIDVGLVGAKLIYPYGLLQEAGGIVNYKGEPANYGKFDDPNHIHYNYLRETDYCSGACILLLRSDLDELGGFDETFAPAYYEDTDLAFRIRYQLNKRVYYQPLSRVIHFEGVSSGKISNGSNIKSYQRINAERFKERWESVFSTFPREDDVTANARKFIPAQQTILIIEPLLPTFDQDSGSRRMFELIKLFLQLNWKVIYSPDARTQEEPYYSMLVNMGVWVFNKPDFQKSSKNNLQLVAPWVHVAWICRPNMNKKYGRFIKKLGIRWINDTVDLHFLREERALHMLESDWRAKNRVRRHKQRELTLISASDTVITVTSTEAKLLEDYGIKDVDVIPNIHYPIVTDPPCFQSRRDICFIGGYYHQPNVDAAIWLVKEIMPLVWRIKPEINVHLLGSNPPRALTELQCEQVFVPGYIEDVSPYFLSNRVFVAPLRYGAGMKGKIGQSFEFGLPVVTTDIGAEGMGLVDRKHYLRANTVEEFADAIIELYHDNQLWANLSKGAFAALEPYSVVQVSKKLKRILNQGALDELEIEVNC